MSSLLFEPLRRQVILLATILLLASGAASWGGQLDDPILSTGAKSRSGEAVKDEEEDDLSIVAVPVPIVDPTLGNGLAPAALVTFPADAGASTPRSTFGLVAANDLFWLKAEKRLSHECSPSVLILPFAVGSTASLLITCAC